MQILVNIMAFYSVIWPNKFSLGIYVVIVGCYYIFHGIETDRFIRIFTHKKKGFMSSWWCLFKKDCSLQKTFHAQLVVQQMEKNWEWDMMVAKNVQRSRWDTEWLNVNWLSFLLNNILIQSAISSNIEIQVQIIHFFVG